MITLRWWVLAVAVVLASVVWWAARHRPTFESRLAARFVPADPGPPADDPFSHVLEVTAATSSGCGDSACPPPILSFANVGWKLRTSAPAALPTPAPQLQGKVCQTGTWNTVFELCTEPFDIVEGEIHHAIGEYLFRVETQAPTSSSPPGTYSIVNIELMVGAKRTATLLIPAMASRAKTTYNVMAPH